MLSTMVPRGFNLVNPKAMPGGCSCGGTCGSCGGGTCGCRAAGGCGRNTGPDVMQGLDRDLGQVWDGASMRAAFATQVASALARKGEQRRLRVNSTPMSATAVSPRQQGADTDPPAPHGTPLEGRPRQTTMRPGDSNEVLKFAVHSNRSARSLPWRFATLSPRNVPLGASGGGSPVAPGASGGIIKSGCCLCDPTGGGKGTSGGEERSRLSGPVTQGPLSRSAANSSVRNTNVLGLHGAPTATGGESYRTPRDCPPGCWLDEEDPSCKGCPPDCMALYETAQWCIAFLDYINDAREFNKHLAACFQVVADYYACSAGHPDCPPITLLADEKAACGPDVTDYFADALARAVDTDYSLHGFMKYTGPGGVLDFKRRTPAAPEKGCSTCKGTVELCGICVDKQVPGNIALGFLGSLVAGYGPTKAFSEVLAKLAQVYDGRDVIGDSDEDKASLMIGAVTAAAMLKRDPLERRSVAIKKKLCAEIETGGAGPNGRGRPRINRQPCAKCGEKWP